MSHIVYSIEASIANTFVVMETLGAFISGEYFFLT